MLLCTVFAEQTVQRLLLSNGKLARLDTGVIDAQKRVYVVHGLCPDVGELLDLGSGILDLLVGQLQAQLLDTGLDRIPASQTVSTIERVRRRIDRTVAQ